MAGDRDQRIGIFRRVAPIFGTIQPARVLRDAERFGHILHPFAEGIYTPRWSAYALSITSMLSSPYTDKIEYLPDRSWTMLYSPKAGGLEVSSNQAHLKRHESVSSWPRKGYKSAKTLWHYTSAQAADAETSRKVGGAAVPAARKAADASSLS